MSLFPDLFRDDELERGESVHFSSATDVWATPQAVFDALNVEFSFDLDVCANAENAKCGRYFTDGDDGLRQEWRGVVWMNPPYSEIAAWMAKAYSAALDGATCVCLIPSRTDTRWWHDYAMRGEIRFLRGRLKFGDATNSAPFPSAVVIFKPRTRIDATGAEAARIGLPLAPATEQTPDPTEEQTA